MGFQKSLICHFSIHGHKSNTLSLILDSLIWSVVCIFKITTVLMLISIGPYQFKRSNDFRQLTAFVSYYCGKCRYCNKEKSKSFFPYHDFYSQKSKNLIQVLSIHLNGWKLDKKLGGIIMLSYASFLVLSILVETNVFFPVNLPTCVVH